MKRLAALILAALLLAGGSASAYDIASLAEKTLSKNFVYKDIPENQSLSFGGGEIPYHMGQLSIIRKRAQKFSSGYIVQAKLPQVLADQMRPYFRMNLEEEQWEGLTRVNRALLNPSSPLRMNMEKTVMSLAVNALGAVAEQNVTAEISEIEPFRRLNADEAYVFTAGAHVTYSAGGMILPMYSRAYFFPSADGKNLDVLMLFTPDEGKDPLVYAIDDLAKEAAKAELLGAGGYKELGVILGERR